MNDFIMKKIELTSVAYNENTPIIISKNVGSNDSLVINITVNGNDHEKITFDERNAAGELNIIWNKYGQLKNGIGSFDPNVSLEQLCNSKMIMSILISSGLFEATADFHNEDYILTIKPIADKKNTNVLRNKPIINYFGNIDVYITDINIKSIANNINSRIFLEWLSRSCYFMSQMEEGRSKTYSIEINNMTLNDSIMAELPFAFTNLDCVTFNDCQIDITAKSLKYFERITAKYNNCEIGTTRW